MGGLGVWSYHEQTQFIILVQLHIFEKYELIKFSKIKIIVKIK